jgi:hypothetical protein
LFSIFFFSDCFIYLASERES